MFMLNLVKWLIKKKNSEELMPISDICLLSCDLFTGFSCWSRFNVKSLHVLGHVHIFRNSLQGWLKFCDGSRGRMNPAAPNLSRTLSGRPAHPAALGGRRAELASQCLPWATEVTGNLFGNGPHYKSPSKQRRQSK